MVEKNCERGPLWLVDRDEGPPKTMGDQRGSLLEGEGWTWWSFFISKGKNSQF